MKWIIDDTEYVYTNHVRENKNLRISFDKLSRKIFGLSFEKWYQDGYWKDEYIPYVLIHRENVVANVSINIIDSEVQGKQKQYIQIGTVMTDNDYRGKGLAGKLIEKVLYDWKDKCHMVYLYANDTVLDFYPRFGFKREKEYQYEKMIASTKSKKRKLNLDNDNDKKMLKIYYEKSNPFSMLPMKNNYGLLMFYCSSFMKDYIYYLEDLDALVIAKSDKNTMTCYDIYCDKNKSMDEILSSTVDDNCKNVIFGFTPKDTRECSVKILEEDDTTLFVLKDKENIFNEHKVMFPLLSHA